MSVLAYIGYCGVAFGLVSGVIAYSRTAKQPDRLYLVALCGAVLLFTITFRLSGPDVMFGDFYKAYFRAGRAAWMHDTDGLIALFTSRRFVNLPIVSVLFAPFAPLSPRTAAHVFFILGLSSLPLVWWLLVRVAELDWRASSAMAVLIASNGPLIYSLKEGNTSHFVFVLVLCAMRCLQLRCSGLAGLCLALAGIVKLPLLALALVLVIRGRWSACGAWLITILGAVTLSLSVFGWSAHVAWYASCVKPFTGATIAAYNAQSLSSFVMRVVLDNPNLRDWTPIAMPWRVPCAAAVVLCVTAAAGVMSGLELSRRSTPPLGTGSACQCLEVELMTILVGSLLTSSISWSHYFLWLLLPVAFVIGPTQRIVMDRLTRRAAWIVVGLGIIPVAVLEIPSGRLAWLYQHLLVSHLTAVGTVTFFVLIRWWSALSRPYSDLSTPEM